MFKQDNGGDTELKAIALFMGSVRSDSIEEEDQHYNETEWHKLKRDQKKKNFDLRDNIEDGYDSSCGSDENNIVNRKATKCWNPL